MAKKKAVVKTARKPAVTMLALWKDPDAQYRPFPDDVEGKDASQHFLFYRASRLDSVYLARPSIFETKEK